MTAVRRHLSEENAAVRRATIDDLPRLARLFAAAFLHDPVFEWLMRPSPSRQAALERFFYWTLQTRTIPQAETWIAANALAAAAWIPPYSLLSPASLFEDLRMLPIILRLTGILRLSRGAALAAAVQDAQPKDSYFYLAFIGVAPRLQGTGLGSLLLERTLARVDAAGASAYLENSNPRNLKLYERMGFAVRREIIARRHAPPLYAMWRPARRKTLPDRTESRTRQGSSTMSQ